MSNFYHLKRNNYIHPNWNNYCHSKSYNDPKWYNYQYPLWNNYCFCFTCLLASSARIPRVSQVVSLWEGNLFYLPMRSCIFMVIAVWVKGDDKAGSLAQSLFIQRWPGSFSCPSIEHWIQPTSILRPMGSDKLCPRSGVRTHVLKSQWIRSRAL